MARLKSSNALTLNLSVVGLSVLAAACLTGASICGWYWWQDSRLHPWASAEIEIEIRGASECGLGALLFIALAWRLIVIGRRRAQKGFDVLPPSQPFAGPQGKNQGQSPNRQM
jgi:hypothetical protein